MFLRANTRKKKGKVHNDFTVVESQRLANGRTRQGQVLYLGELHDAQYAGWVHAIELFEGRDKQPRQRAPLLAKLGLKLPSQPQPRITENNSPCSGDF